MRVVVSTISKFYTFHLARQLEQRSLLARLFTGRMRLRLRGESLPADKVSTFPYCQAVFEALARTPLAGTAIASGLSIVCHRTFDDFTARNLPECDVFHALSYSGLRTGRLAQSRGARWVCDSPTGHPRVQQYLLRDEFQRLGLRHRRDDERLLEYADSSFEDADVTTVLSTFALRTFVHAGVPPAKLRLIPLGADPRRFRAVPRRPDGVFRVLFVGQLSARKGVHDLIDAFRLARLPASRLVLVGPPARETSLILAKANGLDVEVIPPLPQPRLAELYAAADVTVLPSIEDGFGMVITEALACGCPVIASDHTGGPDILHEGVEGFIVPARAPAKIAEKLAWMADHPVERAAMREHARALVDAMGGWHEYGDRTVAMLRDLTGGS